MKMKTIKKMFPPLFLPRRPSPGRSQKGQGLVEYLIIVALIGVATMTVIRVVGTNVSIQFARINEALGGKHINRLNEANVTSEMVQKKDLTNFFEGARNETKSNSNRGDGPGQ